MDKFPQSICLKFLWWRKIFLLFFFFRLVSWFKALSINTTMVPAKKSRTKIHRETQETHLHVCMHACMQACMMYVYIYIYINVYHVCCMHECILYGSRLAFSKFCMSFVDFSLWIWRKTCAWRELSGSLAISAVRGLQSWRCRAGTGIYFTTISWYRESTVNYLQQSSCILIHTHTCYLLWIHACVHAHRICNMNSCRSRITSILWIYCSKTQEKQHLHACA